MPADLSLAEVRRIALGAQGFADRPPAGAVGLPALRRVFARIGLVQIDSVNVVVRAHYVPAYSRLGPYPLALLDRAAYGPRRELFEYWGHEASILPLALQPLLRWRMERARKGLETWGRVARAVKDDPDLLVRLRATIAERGPLPASAFENARGTGSWWGWSAVKTGLEALFWCGEITTVTRKGFARVYDLTERVLPAAIVNAPTPPEPDAQRALVRIAANALGVAAERDLRDYFRMTVADARARIGELVDAGELAPVTVDGLRGTRYLARGARIPRRVTARALVSPFDPLVWERARTRELFGFDYRIEIYTPAHKRVHGYYVLPFVCDETIAARVDLKHDRQAGVLRVLATHLERGVPAREVRAALRDELSRFAAWLGAERVVAR